MFPLIDLLSKGMNSRYIINHLRVLHNMYHELSTYLFL